MRHGTTQWRYTIIHRCLMKERQQMGDADWRVEDVARGCPICEHPLPGGLSPIPPSHYPLQHRLLMNAVRTRRVQCFCDTCRGEVEASLHCSTCLRNLCASCAQEHRQLRHSQGRYHEIIPLWKAKRFRRTTVCLEHPEHPLRFFCIACQQVTCSECMWRGKHRGHASEGHSEAAKKAASLLSNTLKSARALLDTLLLSYSSKSFKNYSARYSTRSHSRAQEQYLYAKEARERVEEFLRLRNARHLLDAISLSEQLLAEGSDAEILSLSRIILKRFHKLRLNIRPRSFTTEHMQQSFKHTGIFHCCTFCSSGGKKEATCACQGKMPARRQGQVRAHDGGAEVAGAAPPVVQDDQVVPGAQQADLPGQQYQAAEWMMDVSCIICCDARRNRICSPCGHIIFCDSCATRFAHEAHLLNPADDVLCPVCHRIIAEMTPAYVI